MPERVSDERLDEIASNGFGMPNETTAMVDEIFSWRRFAHPFSASRRAVFVDNPDGSTQTMCSKCGQPQSSIFHEGQQ